MRDFAFLSAFGSIRPIPLVGGDRAVKELERIAFALLRESGCETGEIPAAEAYEKDKVYLTKNQDAKTADLLTDILVTSKISDEPAETQIAVIEQLLNETEFEPDQEKRVLIYLENAWLSILNTCMTERTYGTGYQKACDALERLPDSTKIKKMQKSFYDNCIAIIHNNFAKQANAGYFDDARKILEAGMQVFPDDKTLKNDLVTLERMMK